MSDPAEYNARFDTARILQAASEVGVMGGRGHAAARILAMLSDREAEAAQIAAVIAHEPALAARVLKVANSAMYGMARTISSIDRAIVVLGLEAVRGIAAAACFNRSVPRVRQLSPLDFEAMQRHSVAVAMGCERLAKIGHRRLVCDAFMAGLLHDLGVVVQLRLSELRSIESRPSEPAGEGGGRQGDGRQGAAHLHELCTSTILEEWGFPESLVAATAHHHTPRRAPQAHRTLAAIVNVAESLVQAGGAGFHFGEAVQETPEDWALELLKLSSQDIASASGGLIERADSMLQAVGG